MSLREAIGMPLLRQIDPERAHHLALSALRLGVAPLAGPVTSDRLACDLAGMALPNPVGLAAGFDKNATAAAPLMRAGFGFLELGAATPLPQSGNPRPRLFRLTEDRAVINRFGFNNDGAVAIAARLAGLRRDLPVGLNLGANKTSEDRAADFASVLARCGAHVDFATVNVSSPNTEKLRDLQGPQALRALLAGVMEVRDGLARRIPIFLKIAPDLESDAIEQIAEVALDAKLDGIIATNTTLAREGLRSPHAPQAGGLSGAPLFEPSTRVLARLSQATGGALPIIGVGGIASADQAWEKLCAGASAVQLYSALVYQGLGLAAQIARDLDARLLAEGKSLADVTGSRRSAWL